LLRRQGEARLLRTVACGGQGVRCQEEPSQWGASVVSRPGGLAKADGWQLSQELRWRLAALKQSQASWKQPINGEPRVRRHA